MSLSEQRLNELRERWIDDNPGRTHHFDCALTHPGCAVALLADEIDRLKRWQAEATEVLDRWERVYWALGSPGRLGQSKADAALAAVQGETP